MPENLKIMVVDDDFIWRKGFSLLLKDLNTDYFKIQETIDLENGQVAIDYIGTCSPSSRPDIVFLDLEMPVLNGFEAAKIILKDYPEIKVICVSAQEPDQIIVDIISMGVHSFLTKDIAEKEWLKAIRSVISDDFYYSDLVNRAHRSQYRKNGNQTSKSNESELTEREQEIVMLISEEKTTKVIAETLSISNQTVMAHRNNIHKKLGVNNAVGVVRYALKTGLIEL